MIIKPIKTSIFHEGDALTPFIFKNIKKLEEKSILIVTSKIVALSENRVRIARNKKDKEKIIKSESQWMMKTRYTWLTIKDDMVMASAGVDESNANGKLILLPEDSYCSAKRIRAELRKYYKVKNLGVVVTDSRLLPLRAGIIGVSLGYAGFKGMRDYRGTLDIFGRKLQFSKTDIADSLAAGAVFLMGEGKEKQPLAVITGAPVVFRNSDVDRRELAIDIKEDIYQPIFGKIKKIQWKRKNQKG